MNVAPRFFGIFEGLRTIFDGHITECEVYEGMYARIYDLMLDHADIEVEIYDSLLRQEDATSVLELACGSGRLLLPLASRGFSVTGIDNSPDMIRLLSGKLAFLEQHLRDRISVEELDMQSLDLEQSFDAAILGAGTLCLMDSEEDRLQLFLRVAKHLKPNGVFIFDYQVPDLSLLESKQENIDFITISADHPKHFMIMGEHVYLDEGLSLVNFFNEIVDDKERTQRYICSTRKRVLHPGAVENTLLRAGFVVDDLRFVPMGDGDLFTGVNFVLASLASA